MVADVVVVATGMVTSAVERQRSGVGGAWGKMAYFMCWCFYLKSLKKNTLSNSPNTAHYIHAITSVSRHRKRTREDVRLMLAPSKTLPLKRTRGSTGTGGETVNEENKHESQANDSVCLPPQIGWLSYVCHVNFHTMAGITCFETCTLCGCYTTYQLKHEKVLEVLNWSREALITEHGFWCSVKVFKNEVENQLGKTIKALRSDRGSEYISQEFKYYLKACGIVQQLTPPYTSQHNGVSEKRNRTLLDMVRSIMNLTTLLLSFWDYALESVTRILNMVSTKKVDKTPYELWYGKVPNLSYLKVWDCEALMKRDTPDKLQQRFVKRIFIGYPKETVGYYFCFPPKNKIVVARYAEFFEKNIITQEVSERAIDFEEIQDEDTSPSEITSKIPIEVEGFEPPQGEEIQSMIDNMVWVLVDLPPGCKIIGSKWIFKKKTDMDGIVHTYKASFAAKGYTQLYEVDYEETFSPVADIRAIRILISIAKFYDYEIWKMDVKTAFLNGYLDENIYMIQPEGFVDPNHPRKVCKLQRSIYGLKQASRSWNKRFDEEIKKFDFAQNHDEPCVYQKASGSNVTFLISDRSKRLIGLSQNAYMDKILKRYKIDNSKHGHISMQERLDLNKTQGASTPKEVKRMQNVPYSSAVGSVMYETAVKNIFKYLRNTKDMFLVYGGNPKAELRVDCYCNVGFETDIDDMKSLIGYVSF
nr:hypothetical protein [Tanacetum cinerariifolium]